MGTFLLNSLFCVFHQYISDMLQSSKSRTRMAGRARLSLSHTVLLSLTLLSERVSYRTVSRRFQLEKGNIHRIFFSFCHCINMLEERHIRWPLGASISRIINDVSAERRVDIMRVVFFCLFSRQRSCRGTFPILQSTGKRGRKRQTRCSSGPGSVGTHPDPYPPAHRET